MSSTPSEVGGNRVRWAVPAPHVGDGRWHEGRVAYDFTGVKGVVWVHVGARVFGDTSEMWLDDICWVPEVGPVVQVAKPDFSETPGQEGRDCTLTATVVNLGDAVANGLRCSLDAPRKAFLAACLAAGRRVSPAPDGIADGPGRQLAGSAPILPVSGHVGLCGA